MLGFGALGEFPLADFGTAAPGTSLSLPAVAISGTITTVAFRGGRNLDLAPADYLVSGSSIGILAGKWLALSKATFDISAKQVAPLPGKSLGLPPKALSLLFGAVSLQTGRIFNLADTFAVSVEIGALGEGALGEFVTGDGEELSVEYTRPIRLALNAQTLGASPGKSFGLPPFDVLLTAPPFEVDARGRRIRINAIAS